MKKTGTIYTPAAAAYSDEIKQLTDRAQKLFYNMESFITDQQLNRDDDTAINALALWDEAEVLGRMDTVLALLKSMDRKRIGDSKK